jgi:hypothetical protein
VYVLPGIINCIGNWAVDFTGFKEGKKRSGWGLWAGAVSGLEAVVWPIFLQTGNI